MTENESINGWTFEETIKTTENLMEVEKNMFKWDVLRHLRDFAENYKDELEQYRAIGTIEEFKELKEKNVAKKPIELDQWGEYWECSTCGKYAVDNLGCRYKFCPNCGTKFDWQ